MESKEETKTQADGTEQQVPTEDPSTQEISEAPVLPGNLSEVDFQKLAQRLGPGGPDMRNFMDMEKKYKELFKPRIFWDTQPVPRLSDKADENKEGEIDTEHDVEKVPKEPFPLLDQFEWSNVDITNAEQHEELYKFLYENYVEDEDGMFRFDYSKDFLRWALSPPGYYPEWLIGVRVKKSKKLVGFISGIPVHISANGTKVKMSEINFLCVHKKLRANRLAPVLIKEVTRRVHARNIWQAVYTAGTLIPAPITQSKYFHRSLNPKKLIEVKFSSLPSNSTMSRTVKLYKLPDEPLIRGIRAMKKKDVAQVNKLLNENLSKYAVHMKFSEEECKHWLLPREGVISTYVVENGKEITDFCSFYSLPSSILQSPKYDRLNAAYSFYNAANTVSLKELFNDALILAAKEGFDVFNALNILENEDVFSDLKFSQGDGNLYYYLYNWRLSKHLKPSDIGIVLL